MAAGNYPVKVIIRFRDVAEDFTEHTSIKVCSPHDGLSTQEAVCGGTFDDCLSAYLKSTGDPSAHLVLRHDLDTRDGGRIELLEKIGWIDEEYPYLTYSYADTPEKLSDPNLIDSSHRALSKYKKTCAIPICCATCDFGVLQVYGAECERHGYHCFRNQTISYEEIKWELDQELWWEHSYVDTDAFHSCEFYRPWILWQDRFERLP